LAYKESTLEQRTIEFISKNQLVPKDTTILVALSGGPDSVCLLHLLINLRKDLKINLHVAHLNHKLRGPESDDDAWYVIALCEQLKVPVTIDTRDVMAYHKLKHLTLEEAAREMRYQFFSQVMKYVNADCIATAHTKDDNVETVIMHIIRGCGIDGLRGLQPKSTMTLREESIPITLIRPLLEVSKQETHQYCKAHRLKPRDDSSNKSAEFFRNRIRLQLLPALREYNPSIDTAILRLASIASDYFSFTEHLTHEIWATLAENKNGIIYLDRQKLITLPRAMQSQIFRQAVQAILGNTSDLEASHVEDAIGLLKKRTGKKLNLPHNLRLSLEYDRIVLARENQSSCIFPAIKSEISLKVPGETQLPGWKITTLVTLSPYPIQGKSKFSACFDLEKTGKIFYVRNRKKGDKFQPLGMTHQKKFQDFMVDARIPSSWRDRVPIVYTPDQIIWVVGYRIDDRVKISKSTKKVINIIFERIEESDCGFRA